MLEKQQKGIDEDRSCWFFSTHENSAQEREKLAGMGEVGGIVGDGDGGIEQL